MSDQLIITQDGKEITLTMYEGVLTKCMSVVGELDEIATIAIKPDKVTELTKIVLTEYDDDGNSKGYKTPPFKLSVENSEKILAWVTENCVNFTMAALKKAAKVLRSQEEEMKNLTPTKVG